MITQYRVTSDFTYNKSGILIPVSRDSKFNYNFISKKYDWRIDVIMGCWDDKIQKKIGTVLEIDEKFINNNPGFFEEEEPTIFTKKEVLKLIKDLKDDVECSGGKGYFLNVSEVEKVYKKFVNITKGKDIFAD